MPANLSYTMNFVYVGPPGTPFVMAEPSTLGSMSTALSQTLSLDQVSTNQPTQGGELLAPPPAPGPSDPNVNPNPETPVKRRPGRPKGSGKKSVDLSPQNQKPKRPVGRPRKDGLPPGTVVEKKQRPRKRPPGNFASVGVNGQAPGMIPFGVITHFKPRVCYPDICRLDASLCRPSSMAHVHFCTSDRGARGSRPCTPSDGFFHRPQSRPRQLGRASSHKARRVFTLVGHRTGGTQSRVIRWSQCPRRVQSPSAIVGPKQQPKQQS